MKSISKVGIVEKILNRFGYYKPVVKKTRKPRTTKAPRKAEPAPQDTGTMGLEVGPLT